MHKPTIVSLFSLATCWCMAQETPSTIRDDISEAGTVSIAVYDGDSDRHLYVQLPHKGKQASPFAMIG